MDYTEYQVVEITNSLVQCQNRKRGLVFVHCIATTHISDSMLYAIHSILYNTAALYPHNGLASYSKKQTAAVKEPVRPKTKAMWVNKESKGQATKAAAASVTVIFILFLE